MRITLLTTCLAENFLPRTLIAMVKLLEHFGHTVDLPLEQTCCGQPMFNNGFMPEARSLARRVLRLLGGAEVVVLPSASCTAMIRRHYPELFPPDSPEHRQAVALGARSYEFTELLVRVLKIDLHAAGARWDGRVAVHSSCHMRDLGGGEAAPRLLEQIDGLESVLLEKAEQCCGFGGIFASKFHAVSGALVTDKVADIESSGARTVVCSEAGCTMNMAGACHRHGLAVRFESLAELVAESLSVLTREVGP